MSIQFSPLTPDVLVALRVLLQSGLPVEISLFAGPYIRALGDGRYGVRCGGDEAIYRADTLMQAIAAFEEERKRFPPPMPMKVEPLPEEIVLP
jgi:hypothetical protein